MSIGNQLYFDVSRLFDKFFNKHAIITKGIACFILGGSESFTHFFKTCRDAHTFTATAGGCFEHDRATDLFCDFICFIGIGHRVRVSGNGVDTSVISELLGFDLVAHDFYGTNTWPDKDHPGFFQGFRKGRVLGQETEARVNCIGVGVFDCFENILYREITFGRGIAANIYRLICLANMQGMFVSIGVDSNRCNA